MTEIATSPYRLDGTGDFYVHRNAIDKAAVLCLAISGKKPFKSCNVKTGIISMITLLELNGVSLHNYKESLPDLSNCLQNDSSEEAVILWIKRHTE